MTEYAVLEENAEAARNFDQTLVEYIQEDFDDSEDTQDAFRSVKELYVKKSSETGYKEWDKSNQHEGLIEWNPYISVDSFTGNHSDDKAVKFNILHWMKVWTNCSDYFSVSVKQRLVYPYYHGNCNHDPKAPSITLATQMDPFVVYWQKLEQTVQNWNGPVSVALHITLDHLSEMADVKEKLEKQFTTFNLHKYSVCVHLLIEKKQQDNYLYPINSLRNVAVKYSHTKYIFYVEADFIPMPGLAEYVQNIAESRNTSKMALVVPAFKSPKFVETFPRNKTELLLQWQQNITIPWCEGSNWKYGHLPTMYNRIRHTDTPYQVNYTSNYEPYYIVEKERSPYYPEEVLYGSKDKIVHAALMNQSGYQFVVLPNTFIIHTPHVTTSHMTLTPYQIRCAYAAVHNLLRRMRELTKTSLSTYMKTNLKVQERKQLQAQIKVRMREPTEKELMLPAEMKNASVYIKHVPQTYRKYKKHVSQRQKTRMHQSVHEHQPEVQRLSELERQNLDEHQHWWAFG